MSEVKRYTACLDGVPVGKQVVLAEDYEASLSREAALREELANHDSASKLMGAWVSEKGQMPWVTAINIMAIATKMPDAERQRLMDMDDGSAELSDLQQRLTVAEQREAEAREELLELSRKLDVFYSKSHGIKNLSEIEKANDKAKDLKLKVGEYEVLLNTSMELLTTISRHGATTKPVDWCDSFKAEVADRIEKIGSALKPAAEPEHVCKGCGSKGWTANCAQCVPY